MANQVEEPDVVTGGYSKIFVFMGFEYLEFVQLLFLAFSVVCDEETVGVVCGYT